jgi:hypothetical protein
VGGPLQPTVERIGRVHDNVGERGAIVPERSPAKNAPTVERVIRRGIPAQLLAGIESKPSDARVEECGVSVSGRGTGDKIEVKRKSWLHDVLDWQGLALPS